MPPLSLYIDEKTLRQLQIAAEIEHISISKYVVKKLNESMFIKWPDHYEDLYGSIADETFNVKNVANFNNDYPREGL